MRLAYPQSPAAAVQGGGSYTLLWTTLWNTAPPCVERLVRKESLVSVPAVPELDAMWERIVSDVPISSRAWLRRTKPIAMHSNTVMLAVSDETTRERIETKLRTEIETKLSTVTGTRTYLAFVIDPSCPSPPGPGCVAPNPSPCTATP